MRIPDGRFFVVFASRRDFLRATSTLAGSVLLGSLGPECDAWAAPAPGGAPADRGPGPQGPITIRGHHLFDMLDALGTGKSAHKTLGPVAQKIRANPTVPIKVVIGVDDICGPCEWWDREKSRCKKNLEKYPRDNENSLSSDKNAIRVLGMKPGNTASAVDLYRLIRAKVTKKVFAEEVCVACRLVDKCKETYEGKIEAAVKGLSQNPGRRPSEPQASDSLGTSSKRLAGERGTG